MTPVVIPGVPVSERRHSRVLEQALAAPRGGVMIHYDDSSRDDWALDWFSDPRCTNGYTWLVLDDGSVIELADPGMRTPHAGPCVTKNANSHFYGIAAATNGRVLATPEQVESIVACLVPILIQHGWTDPSDLSTRIVGHDEQAIWTPAYTRDAHLWGTLGRKSRPDRHSARQEAHHRRSGDPPTLVIPRERSASVATEGSALVSRLSPTIETK